MLQLLGGSVPDPPQGLRLDPTGDGKRPSPGLPNLVYHFQNCSAAPAHDTFNVSLLRYLAKHLALFCRVHGSGHQRSNFWSILYATRPRVYITEKNKLRGYNCPSKKLTKVTK